MAVVSGSGGRLNPSAEPFVPSGVRYCGLQAAEAAAAAPEQEVEDSSPEWWPLVSASPAFRDRWLREYGALGLLDAEEEDLDEVGGGFLPDADFFSPSAPRQGGTENSVARAGKKVSGGGLDVAPSPSPF